MSDAAAGLPLFSLPAPTVSPQTNRNFRDNRHPSGEPRDVRHSLERLIPMRPAPTTHDAGSPRSAVAEMADRHYLPHDLQNAVESLPAPKARDFATPMPEYGRGSNLEWRVHVLPAPVVADGSDPTHSYAHNPTLIEAVNSLPAPTSQDAIGSGAAGYSTSSGRHSGTTLTDAVCGAASAGRRGRLNPLLSEWIQGLPAGWSDCEALETSELPRWWRLSRSFVSRVVSDWN